MLKSLPIHYFVTGEAKKGTLLFVHPAFGDHRCFDKQVDYFSGEYKVITMDLLGHGLSQGFKTKDKIDKTSDYIKEIMDAESIEKANLIGVSVGGLLIQDFANKYPERVLSLCIVGAYDINNFDAKVAKQQNKQQAAFIFKALVSIRWFAKANMKVAAITEDAQKKFYEMNLLFKKHSLPLMSSLVKIMNKYKVQTRKYPLLILCGESDHPLAIQQGKQFNERVENSKFALIKNAGHCANMDNPKEFNEQLDLILL